jgi:hypothetical protein
MIDLKKYDKRLQVNRRLDGTKLVERVSPYNSAKAHKILSIENQYIGSGRWVRNELIRMDTTRFDLVGDTLRHNWSIRHDRSDDRMTRDIADFIAVGGNAVIL